jgi:hypothetical protein
MTQMPDPNMLLPPRAAGGPPQATRSGRILRALMLAGTAALRVAAAMIILAVGLVSFQAIWWFLQLILDAVGGL